MSASQHYEMFKMYYDKAIEYKDKGDMLSCKKFLLKAVEKLIESAKESDGSVKRSQMLRAKSIIEIAEGIDTTARANSPSSGGASKSAKPRNNDGGIENQEGGGDDGDEGNEFLASGETGITFDDVAGLQEVKEAVKNRILLPMQYPEYYKMVDLKAGGGILMYGLPGTGKTMIAKAIASEVGGNFYQIKCSDIVSKWFGEAEKNLKNLFAQARSHDRAVIFFDEFEAIGVKRGGDSSAMNRIVPELLAQMQGFGDSKGTLLILAATNRPWDIDSALLRPGRFNELLYVPLPDFEARKYLIGRKLKDLVLSGVTIAEMATETDGHNGADCNELCDRLKMCVLRELIENKSQEMLPITRQHFDEVIGSTGSSVLSSDIQSLEKFEQDMRKNK